MTGRDNCLTLSDMAVIRSAGLRGFASVVAELGGDPAAYADRAGLPREALHADDVLVPDLAAARVLEVAAAALDRPDLGLLVASRQDLSLLGPLALAIQNSPTIADSWQCTSRYLFVHAPAMRIARAADPDGEPGVEALCYEYDVTAPGVPLAAQGTDLCLGTLHRNLRSLVGGSYGLRTVDLPHPALAPRSVYEDFFGARVRFERPTALLRLPSSLGTTPISGRDEAVRRLALDFLDQQTPSTATGAQQAPRVREVVRSLLGTGAPEVAVVAGLLDQHPRTLQRRLAAERTSFATILDDARRVEAHRYLTTTDLALSQVAGAIGLSEQSALTRAARRWWGRTPTRVRRESRHATP